MVPKLLLFILLLSSVIAGNYWLSSPNTLAQPDQPRADLLESPLPTPALLLSKEAEIALRYVSETQGIPLEQLVVVNEHERHYPLTKRSFIAFGIWYQDRTDSPDIKLLVDLHNGAVEADLAVVEDAERAAYQAQYGKLHPTLYARLQEIGDDEVLPVAIWAAPHPAVRTQAEIFAELVAKYPQAGEALEMRGVPWAVDEPSLVDEIQAEYQRMRSEDTAIRLAPVVAALSEEQVSLQRFDAMPSLAAYLAKSAILKLAEHENVGQIYLINAPGEPAMAEAAATNRMPQSWYTGSLSGAGRRIAILEPNTVALNTNCLTINSPNDVRTMPYNGDWPELPDHKTKVAAVAACNHTTYRGIAYGANIIDAGVDNTGAGAESQIDAVNALTWAIQDRGANVVNTSYVWDASRSLQWLDRAFDYWAWSQRVPIVVAAGNQNSNVRSPGKGWNVLTVGGSNDQGNSNWSDDGMYNDSNWINPHLDGIGTPGDREKPEIVAPAVGITMIGPGGTPATTLGTSYAAPQVAGLTALMMNRNGNLVTWPEAVKAIIMASAVHNIRDARHIPTGQDLRDGAGSINANLALETASTYATTGTILGTSHFRA